MKINRWMTLSLFLVLLTGCEFSACNPPELTSPCRGVSEFSLTVAFL